MGDTEWTLASAVELCVALEAIAPNFGAHVALTGGTLYKIGPRKDVDILIYRIRHVENIDVDGFMLAASEIGIEPGRDFGWCYRATYRGKPIDFFFPERDGGQQYPPHVTASSLIDDDTF